ncbi:MAG: hypothetical protein QOJ89_837 [bacterium]
MASGSRPCAAEVDVRARQRQAVGAEKAEEAGLELAQCHVRTEGSSQLRRAGLARVARDAGLDVVRPRAVVHPRLVARASEFLGPQCRREVEQRARHRRDRDTVQLEVVTGGQRADAMDDDARTPAAAESRNRDLRRRRRAAPELQEVSGGSVAENGALAAGQHSRKAVAEGRATRVPDGVHAVVHAVQPAIGQPAARTRLVDAGLAQVPRADTPMLRRSLPSDDGEKLSHTAT